MRALSCMYLRVAGSVDTIPFGVTTVWFGSNVLFGVAGTEPFTVPLAARVATRPGATLLGVTLLIVLGEFSIVPALFVVEEFVPVVPLSVPEVLFGVEGLVGVDGFVKPEFVPVARGLVNPPEPVPVLFVVEPVEFTVPDVEVLFLDVVPFDGATPPFAPLDNDPEPDADTPPDPPLELPLALPEAEDPPPEEDPPPDEPEVA